MSSRQANALVLPRETLVLHAAHGHHLHLPECNTQLSQGISLLPGSEMWRSSHCFCSAPCFTDSKVDDCEGKCLFCCKKVSASGPPGAARAMFLIPTQIIEELLDKVVLLKWMVWKWLTGRQREWVKGSLNDTEDWPYLTGTVGKIEIRYFHSS